MKYLIEKWLEIKKIKYEKLYCKHDWEKKEGWDVINKNTNVRKEGVIILYICKKCGKMKKVEVF